MGWLGLVKARGLWRFNKYALILSAVVGGVLTPGPDVLSQLLMAGPLFGLFNLSILLVWLIERGRAKHLEALAKETGADLVPAASALAARPGVGSRRPATRCPRDPQLRPAFHVAFPPGACWPYVGFLRRVGCIHDIAVQPTRRKKLVSGSQRSVKTPGGSRARSRVHRRPHAISRGRASAASGSTVRPSTVRRACGRCERAAEQKI